jgi:hypothetical protein
MRPRHIKVEDVHLALPKLSERERARTEHFLERWEAVNHQIENRMSKYTKALEKLHTYQTALNSEETWLTNAERKIRDLSLPEKKPEEQVVEGIEARMEELTVSGKMNEE